MPLPRLTFNSLSYPVDTYLLAPDKQDAFNLEAPYQRGSVWGQAQREALVKSLYMGLPVGVVYLNRRGGYEGKFMTVVDGKQRIETLRAFHQDEFTVPADWFDASEVTASVDGRVAFSGLSKREQLSFKRALLPALESTVKTEAEEAEVFMLVNAAGVAQTDETLAHAQAYL